MNNDEGGKTSGFSDIQKEIMRQYEQGIRTSESLDSKIGIMLGFIVVTISIIGGFIIPITPNQTIPLNLFVLILGIILLLIAAFIGFWAYYVREFKGGPDPTELVEMYRNNPDRNYEMVIASVINDSRKANRGINKKKAKLTKTMFIVLFIALVLTVISRF